VECLTALLGNQLAQMFEKLPAITGIFPSPVAPAKMKSAAARSNPHFLIRCMAIDNDFAAIVEFQLHDRAIDIAIGIHPLLVQLALDTFKNGFCQPAREIRRFVLSHGKFHDCVWQFGIQGVKRNAVICKRRSFVPEKMLAAPS
jgi:hypothetical protein